MEFDSLNMIKNIKMFLFKKKYLASHPGPQTKWPTNFELILTGPQKSDHLIHNDITQVGMYWVLIGGDGGSPTQYCGSTTLSSIFNSLKGNVSDICKSDVH